MTTVSTLTSRRPAVDMSAIERTLEQPGASTRLPETPGPTEAETMAHLIHDGVNFAQQVKGDIERIINGCEHELQALKQQALEFLADVAGRQAAIEERASRFTEDCANLRKGMSAVYKKLGERAKA